jgi:tripartite ATP-independent transporter DctP family solute receptor
MNMRISSLAKSLAWCTVVVLLLGTCGGKKEEATAKSSSTAEQPVRIRFASTTTSAELAVPQTTAGISLIYFRDEIQKRTNGRITVEYFPDGQLASSTEEHIGGLQNGAFDICNLNCGSWADYTPAFAGLNIPYLYFDFETAYAVLDSEIGQGWMKAAQDATGTIPLAYVDIGFRELTNSLREVRVPADLRGVKLRVMPDPLQVATWEALGVAVTPIPYAELYTALQQKLVDGQENPVSNIVGNKLYELQPYMTMTNHNFTVTIIAASPIFWNKLSAVDQKLISELWIETQNMGRQNTAKLVEAQIKTIRDNKVNIYTPTTAELRQFQDQVKKVWPQVEKVMGTEEYNKLVNFVNDYMAQK